MKTLTLLLTVLCTSIVLAQTPLEIRGISCPGTFPKPNASIPYEVIVRNNDTQASIAQRIGLFQEYSAQEDNTAPNYGYANVPALAPNEEINVLLDAFFPENWLFPGNTTFSASWGNFYLSLQEEGLQKDFPLDIYCQTFRSDIAIEITSPEASYGEDFMIDYQVTVINNGNETAHNIFANYAQTGNPYGYLGDVGVPSQGRLYYVGNSPYTQRWYIPTLAPGERATLDIEFNILNRDGVIYPFDGSPFLVEVSVESGHSIDSNPINNRAALSFSKEGDIEEFVDLELSLRVNNSVMGQYESQMFFLTVNNTGTADVTDIGVDFPFSTQGVVQTGGSTVIYENGVFDTETGMWRNINLAAGESTILGIELYNLNEDEWTIFAQIVRANGFDVDSTPNNFRCCTTTEDDEAVLLMNYIPKPDLTLSNIFIPNSLNAGTSAEFAFSLDNIGDIAANNIFSTMFFLSEDANLDSGDQLLAPITFEGLALGAFPTVVSLDIPDNLEGEYQLLIIVDPYGTQAESDETNNAFSFPIEILQAEEEEPLMVDLELNLSTNNPDIGQYEDGVFQLTIENKGEADATGVVVHMPLLRRASIMRGTDPIISQGFLSDPSTWRLDVAAGETATYEVHLFSLMYRLELFAQVIKVEQEDMDSTPNNGQCCTPEEDDEAAFPYNNNIIDNDDTDNNIDDTTLADLSLSAIQVPSNLALVEHIRFNLKVDNIGQDSARGDFVIGFYLSEDEILDNTDTYIGHILTGDLEIGSHDATALVSIPREVSLGNYHFLAVADVDRQVEEANEDNNLFAFPVEVLRQNGVDLELALSVQDPSMPKYTANTATLSLTNAGNKNATGVQLSFPFNGQVVLVGGTVPEASQGRFNSFTGLWEVQDLAAGETATLVLQLYPLEANFVPYAQVSACEQEDIDSTPNNGVCCAVNEDDEAMATVGNGQLPNYNGQTNWRIQLAPNPASDFIQVYGIYEASTPYTIYHSTGKSVQKGTLGDGTLSIENLASGTYYLDVKKENTFLLSFVKLY